MTFNYHQNILYLQKCTTYRKREQQLFLIKKQAFDKVEASDSMYADFLLDFFLSYISLPFPPWTSLGSPKQWKGQQRLFLGILGNKKIKDKNLGWQVG